VLSDLRVRDLGVIDDLTLQLEPGMTAITGETGAGKTLVVEAVELVLGGRAVAGLVRAGAAEALVEARFVVVDDGDAEREVVLGRSIPLSGRSRAWLDGRMATVGALSDASEGLLDVHGQHERESLLSQAAQRRALDAFAATDLGPLTEARRHLASVDEQLAALGGDPQQRAREADVLGHQAAEIAAAHLRDGEEADLRAEEARLSDLGAHRAAASVALAALDGEQPGNDSVLELLGAASDALGDRAPFADVAARLRGAQADLSDLASELRRAVETWEDDPAALADVQGRLHMLADLRHKYGPTLSDVIAFGAEAERRLEALAAAAGRAEELAAARETAVRAVADAEGHVRAVRQRAAPDLADAAGRRLAELAMRGARFEISVGDDGPGDDVVFGLGANPGEPVQPLARVASGGELARSMLALRLVAREGPDTMVFDEVDAGVGGAAALSLGRALREVARDRQVLVVTHLAQVAAFADQQIAVRKHVRGGRTLTTAETLGDDERVVELSRMLSGHPDSATARAHAEELLASAQGAGASTTAGRAVD